MTATMPRMTPPTTENDDISATIAITSEAMPSPLRGPAGGRAYPAYGCGGGGGNRPVLPGGYG